MNIPQSVKDKAPEGSTIEYLGKCVGLDAYQAYYPDKVTGFHLFT